jgi:hypothetical protein
MWPFTPEVVRLVGRSSGAPGAGRRVSLSLGKNSRCGLRARKRERLLCLTKQAWSSIKSLPLFSLREICGFFPLAYSLTLPPQNPRLLPLGRRSRSFGLSLGRGLVGRRRVVGRTGRLWPSLLRRRAMRCSSLR